MKPIWQFDPYTLRCWLLGRSIERRFAAVIEVDRGLALARRRRQPTLQQQNTRTKLQHLNRMGRRLAACSPALASN
jgi:hypothetical protein